MKALDIAFPHLGIYIRDIPKSFTVFGYEIALYGCMIVMGIIMGFALVLALARKSGQDVELYWDFAIYVIAFSIVGARVYYVIFSWEKYKDNLWEIFNIRGGGMAIYVALSLPFLPSLSMPTRKWKILGVWQIPVFMVLF